MAISVGSVEVDVVPNTQGIYDRLKAALEPAAARAGTDAGRSAGRAFGPALSSEVSGAVGERIGEQLGQTIGRRIASSVRDSLADGVTAGGRQARPAATRQGDETAGAFARAMKSRLEAAFRSLPKADVRLSDTGVDADLARLRARLETLSGKRLGIDVDVEAADAEIEDIEQRLTRLGTAHPNIAVRADTAAALAQLAAMREEIDRLSDDPARVRVETDDGQFAARLRAQVLAAQQALPAVEVDVDTAPAQIEIARIRSSLGQLADARIGVDVDTGTALAQVAALRARLDELGARDADVAVRVDAAAAEAQLAEVAAMVAALDGDTARIDVDTSGALSAVMQLGVAVAGLAAIPAAAVLAAGIGGIATAAIAAGAGIGVLAAAAIPAISGIKNALSAQKQAQDAAAVATANGGQAAAQAASRALQLQGAQASLVSAERNGARQIAQAQEQVVQARQAAAQATTQAAQRNAQAARAVEDAERQLTQSQTAARQAQLDLTAARKQAAQQLEDLANQYTDAQLSQRDAALSLQQAQQDLNVTLADPTATTLQRKQAQLTYDQAVQRLKEQTLDTKRLASQQADADRKGVEGSDTVVQARQRVADAQQQVADQTRAVQDAQAQEAQTQVETAQQVAQAQQRVSDATSNVAVAQQSAADAVASAQRQIQSAQLSAAGTASQAATAQAKYQAALAALSPAARRTMTAFTQLRTAFTGWSRSLQPDVMPLFTRALNELRALLPSLTPLVRAAAGAVGDLEDKLSAQVRTPFWRGMQRDLQTAVGPAITGLGVAFGNVIKGMAGVVDAFLPHMDDIAGAMQRITARFATWGTGLKGSPEFEQFLSYASQMAPRLGHALGQVVTAFLAVARALSPLSGPLLIVLAALASGIAAVANNAPWLIQAIYLLVTAMKIWTIAQWALNVALDANPIALIIIAIAALVAGVIYAYQHWGLFRAAVQTAWAGIRTAALLAWNAVLKPVLGALVVALRAVGTAAVWLWQTILQPVFSSIGSVLTWLWSTILHPVIGLIVLQFQAWGTVLSWLYTNVAQPVFSAIGSVITFFWNVAGAVLGTAVAFVRNVLGPAFSWLYKHVVQPVFSAIGKAISLNWQAVKIVFQAIRHYILSPLGGAFTWLYDHAVKPIWNSIKSVIGTVWDRSIRPAFSAMKSGVHLVASAFSDARDAIGKAWNQLEAITKKPVNFLISTVYMGGIRRVWDTVVDAFGGKDLPKLTPLATGGVLPGYTPGRDVHLAALSGGEAVMRPEWTRAVGPSYVHAMNAAARHGGVGGVQRALGLPAFKDGGIFQGIGDFAAGAWDKVKSGAHWLADTFGGALRSGVKAVIKPLINLIPKAGGFTGLLRGGALHMVDVLTGAGKKADDLSGSHLSGKIPAGKHRTVISQALKGAGVPPPGTMQQWLTGMNTLITRESGWNASAVNRWDSNAKAGIPSQGLAQVIPPTFAANVPKSLRGRGILDPVANVAAAVRYIVHRYGNITRVQQANAALPPKGYDSGGYLQPGLNLAYNGTGRPEPVFTTQQANALTRMAGMGNGSTTSGLQPGDALRLVVDGREFHGYVDARAGAVVHTSNQHLATALAARPRRSS